VEKSHNKDGFKPYEFHQFIVYSFTFQQSHNKICRLFPNYAVNYQDPYFVHLLQELRSLFRPGLESTEIKTVPIFNVGKERNAASIQRE